MKPLRALGLLVAGLLSLVVAAFALAASAFAHAVVVGSNPADGARLAAAPASVTVTFDEPVGLSLGYFRVVDNAGERVDVGDASHPNGNSSIISVRLRPGLGDGGYLASYRVVSADSHPIGGTVRFVVGNGSFVGGQAANGDANAINRTVQGALSAAHGAAFVGLAMVGGIWLVFTIWPSGQRRTSIRRLVWAGWGVVFVGTLGEIALQGVYGNGGPLSDVLRWSLLDATLHDSTGQMLSFRLVLLGLLAAVLTALLSGWRRTPQWGSEAAAIIGLGIVVSFAASGHSQTANPRWFAVLVAALHVLAMALWLGGLLTLTLAAARGTLDEPDDRVELLAGLPIFSRVAFLCVVTLAATGTVQAWREVRSVPALVETSYGRLVIAKLALFALVVVLGYFSRQVVLARPTKTQALAQLRRSVLAEVGVAVAVLAATSVLIIQPPAKTALVISRAKPRVASVQLTETSSARIQIEPGTHGPVRMDLDISGGATPLEVTAAASLPSARIGPIPIKLTSSNSRSYRAEDLVLPAKGDWQVNLTVRTSQFDSTAAVATIHLY